MLKQLRILILGRTNEDRYSPQWGRIQKAAMAATDRKCCLCNRKAEQVHHARYSDWKGAIAGRERPGIDVFPVCLDCHNDQCHSKSNWVVPQGKRDRVLGSRNTDRFRRHLVQSYQRRTKGYSRIGVGKVALAVGCAVLGFYAAGWLGLIGGVWAGWALFLR